MEPPYAPDSSMMVPWAATVVVEAVAPVKRACGGALAVENSRGRSEDVLDWERRIGTACSMAGSRPEECRPWVRTAGPLPLVETDPCLLVPGFCG